MDGARLLIGNFICFNAMAYKTQSAAICVSQCWLIHHNFFVIGKKQKTKKKSPKPEFH